MLNELLDEDTGLADVDEGYQLEDELAVRRALIRLAQIDRDRDKVKKTKKAVVETYDQQIERYDRDEAFIRSSLQAWCEAHGTTKFPDAGTAYLSKGEPKIEIVDKDALKAATGAMFVKEVFDETAAKAYALEQATTGGVIVDGTSLIPGGPQLRVRKG